jgi:NAD(P) transhydrogenase subunit alpha
MVEQMKPGSVVVDLASESGGNVEGSVPGEVVRVGNAQVWGGRNVPSQMPGPASKLYAQNIVNLVTLMTAKAEDGTTSFAPDYDDEIVAGSCVTRDGAIRHEPTREAIEGPAAAPPDVPDDPTPAAADTEQPDLPYDQEADQ